MITSVSAKPRVVSTAVRAPVKANTALLDWVVAWTMRSVPASRRGTSSPKPSAALARPSMTPRWRSTGVVSALPMAIRPAARSKTTTSVNVPPISTATVYILRSLRRGRRRKRPPFQCF